MRTPGADRELVVGFLLSEGVIRSAADLGLFNLDGTLEASAEDVGRHNAVDKLLGRMTLAGRLPLDRFLLCVSGRSSFEIVQKAFLGGVALIAAVSAPSSLAVDLSKRSGVTLLGFVRDGRFNVYAHRERVTTSRQGGPEGSSGLAGLDSPANGYVE
jgi:FdhD protein